MDPRQLWAPWRASYVSQPAAPAVGPAVNLLPGGEATCFLCRGAADTSDRSNLLLSRGQHVLTMLNRYPYNAGHLLVAPLSHKGGLAELSPAEQTEIWETITRMCDVATQTMHPDGFNVGLNLGRAAGAGLPGHLHWHLVPRWNGDQNFMPVLADTHVI